MSIMKLKEYAFRLYIHIFSLKTYLTYQQRVQIELSRWLDTYEESRNVLRGKESLEEKKANQLLCSYHTMVTIMTDTCLSPRDETVFDSHTAQFVHLIRQLADLRGICPIHAPRGHLIIMSRSIVDMGCIPPLYYVVVKCRARRIRLQAVRLLESMFHREGSGIRK
jgi:hypothetical protein